MSGAPAALLRFHAVSGLRVALRGPLPAAAALTAGIGMQSDPGAVIGHVATGVVGAGGPRGAAIAAAGVALVIATWATPRLSPAVSGWIRHLPAEAAAHRRALLAALVTAQAPLIVALAGLALLSGLQGDLDPARAFGLPLLIAGAALVAAPLGPPIPRVLAGLAACACGAAGLWIGLAPGLLALIVFDRVAADPAPRRAGPRYRSGSTTAAPARLAWRALGIDAATALLMGMLPAAAGVLMVANNSLGPEGTGRVVRLTALLAATLSTGVLASALARALPAWGWLRSLPGSSARRVTADAWILALPALVTCAAGAWLDPFAALVAALCVPWISLRAAGWMRPERSGSLAVEWLPLAEGSVLACLVCLLPWMAGVALAASPAALAWAARRESARRVSS